MKQVSLDSSNPTGRQSAGEASLNQQRTPKIIQSFSGTATGLGPILIESLIVKHNPLAVCIQETFLKDTDNITVGGFNLYHKYHETEGRASGGVSILVNENIPQSIVTLNN